MAEVKILIEGFTNADSSEGQEEKTCSTISLIRDDGINIIVDPGVLDSQQDLIDKLREEGLSIDDIDIVFITHSHMDHYRNIGMFPKAKALDYWGLWDGQSVDDYPDQITDNIEVIKTPGHNYDCLTLLVKTDKGVIAVVGDVFWKENYPEKDPYASDLEKLEESRKKVLELADYIIPGHGGMYEIRRNH